MIQAKKIKSKIDEAEAERLVEGLKGLVPDSVQANLEFRSDVLALGESSPVYARALYKACRSDLLFWVNTFCWTSNPKKQQFEIPFIAYPHQRRLLVHINECIGYSDLAIPKSRQQGVSWSVIIAFAYRFVFYRGQSFMLVSRTEDLVERTNDPDCLFYKFDFILERLPSWMRPAAIRGGPDGTARKMVRYNPDTRSTVTGAANTEEMGRGGNRTAIMIDEMAAFRPKHAEGALKATQFNTDSRFFVSTPKGAGNAFYRVCNDGTPVHRIHWSDHSLNRMGMYRTDDSKLLVLLDEDYWRTATVGDIRSSSSRLSAKLEGFKDEQRAVEVYPFVLDGKIRSVFYDNECLRMGNPHMIAQELDIDFLSSGSPFFEVAQLQGVIAEFCCEPRFRGELKYCGDSFKPDVLEARSNGRLQIWCNIPSGGRPVDDRYYVMGIDVSQGKGASSSCISVGDCLTKEKVASFVCSATGSIRLAEYATALGRFFTGRSGAPAKMVWEGQGPGSTFGVRLQELHYPNVFWMRERKHDGSKGTSRSTNAGWFPNDTVKQNMLTEYGRALTSGDFINRCRESVEECFQYEFGANGKVIHVGAASESEPSAAKSNHGDQVIADGLCWMLMKAKTTIRPKKRVVLPNSMAARNRLHSARQLAKTSW